MLININLFNLVAGQFRIDLNGEHGVSHWMRVREIGIRLAEKNGANKKIVEYFSYFHDSQRVTDGVDVNHGRRASDFIYKIYKEGILNLSSLELDILIYACCFHSDGMVDGDITTRTCWDSDRLDLTRYGIRPKEELLCTEEARSDLFIDFAFKLSGGLKNESNK